MKHRNTGRTFGRVRRQRKALLQTMLGSLVVHGRIVTTEAKAKELKDRIDPIITTVKKAVAAGLPHFAVLRKIRNRMPAVACDRLIADSGRFARRDSGYTRVVKMVPRNSDQSRMALIEFVD